MADQVNNPGAADPTGNPGGSEEASRTQQPAHRPGDPEDTGEQSNGEKAEAMEEVQRDAAKEREENRGYQ